MSAIVCCGSVAIEFAEMYFRILIGQVLLWDKQISAGVLAK
ncbi:hypothetical protein Pr1d_34560 [Bythopirellula goksoeyrii]|uniref:Uncharacterized protein n=1 Tax=Bythopirellula goksoeyrii TaxID=1400387 RepID=A0A5B9QAU8_9BACT|nr:hypothetical protein Pr1d_34560 [Bythopirellula goksoeyrii]